MERRITATYPHLSRSPPVLHQYHNLPLSGGDSQGWKPHCRCTALRPSQSLRRLTRTGMLLYILRLGTQASLAKKIMQIRDLTHAMFIYNNVPVWQEMVRNMLIGYYCDASNQNYLQTTLAFAERYLEAPPKVPKSKASSQTGLPLTRMFPSWGPDPPTSSISEIRTVEKELQVNLVKI